MQAALAPHPVGGHGRGLQVPLASQVLTLLQIAPVLSSAFFTTVVQTPLDPQFKQGPHIADPQQTLSRQVRPV